MPHHYTTCTFAAHNPTAGVYGFLVARKVGYRKSARGDSATLSGAALIGLLMSSTAATSATSASSPLTSSSESYPLPPHLLMFRRFSYLDGWILFMSSERPMRMIPSFLTTVLMSDYSLPKSGWPGLSFTSTKWRRRPDRVRCFLSTIIAKCEKDAFVTKYFGKQKICASRGVNNHFTPH